MRNRAVCVAGAVVAVFLAGAAPAQMTDRAPGAPAPAEAPKPLVLGDPAPALDIAAWAKGEPVKQFEKGTGYVIEFWATWCGPCRASMPKLTSTAKRFAPKGITVVSVSVDQGADAAEKVKSFVERAGDRMGFTVALDGGKTSSSYMGAVGVGSIPHAFIVDKSGKFVWHGNPQLPSEAMELVLQEVGDGTFDLKKHTERQAKFAELDGKYAAAQQAAKWEEAEKLLDEIEAIRPDISNILAGTHYGIIAGGRKDTPAAMSYAKRVIDRLVKEDPEGLLPLMDRVAGTTDLTPADREYVTKTIQKIVEATDGKSAPALSILGESLRLQGKYDEAIAATERAMNISSEEMEKRYYSGRLDEIRKSKADADKQRAEKPAEPKTDAKP